MGGSAGEDAALVTAARAGSDAAFARLVARHQGALRAFLRRIAGPAAADLAQEAFVAAWTSLRRLKDPAGFRPWLFGIAWRKAADRARGGARRGLAGDHGPGPRRGPGRSHRPGPGAGGPGAGRAGLRRPVPGPGLVA